MPIATGAVLLYWNCAAASAAGRAVYPALIHLRQALRCLQLPEGDWSTGSNSHIKTTAEKQKELKEKVLRCRRLDNAGLLFLLTLVVR